MFMVLNWDALTDLNNNILIDFLLLLYCSRRYSQDSFSFFLFYFVILDATAYCYDGCIMIDLYSQCVECVQETEIM